MGKQILILSSTPRKGGNSDLLCDEFMRGAGEIGHTVEKIRLSDKTIHYCTGCCACIQEPGKCIQQDDMKDILKKFVAADILVLATPVYFHSMAGQMKTFIDRTCPVYTMARNKDIYFILSAAGGAEEIPPAEQSLRVYTDCFSSFTVRGVIASTGIWEAGGVKGTASIRDAYAAGRNA